MTEVKIATPKSEVARLIQRITEMLVMKARKEGLPQNETNKTTLAGVSFWFVTTEDSNSYLVYDSNPESWNKVKFLEMREDLEKFEWVMLYQHASF